AEVREIFSVPRIGKIAGCYVLNGVITRNSKVRFIREGTIIGYGVRPDRKARDLADAEKVEIRTYEIIYHLLEDIESAMVGLLAPEFEEVVTGDAEVREIFSVPRIGKIAGCSYEEREIERTLEDLDS
ncbi:MAG: translation initiation factor IF-2, partial [Acidimicrobiia bacterium]|nr:translation initiation factor IF-2 [Acidimicrobiia bacterium]